MPQYVARDYFYDGVFRSPVRGELFNKFTCLVCGHHGRTWESFKEHRVMCKAQKHQVGTQRVFEGLDEEIAA
jgi:hypothetical protein